MLLTLSVPSAASLSFSLLSSTFVAQYRFSPLFFREIKNRYTIFFPFLPISVRRVAASALPLGSNLFTSFPSPFFGFRFPESICDSSSATKHRAGEMAEMVLLNWRENRVAKCAFAVAGIMSTLLVYGVCQEKIMRVPYGIEKEYFRYSLFLVFCNRIMTSIASAIVLMASNKSFDPIAPVYSYCGISLTNILTTTCQYEALKYVSFPVQTLAKCAKMIPVMLWSTVIMQKKYNGRDYLLSVVVTVGCFIFILYPGSAGINLQKNGRESTVWGVSLMLGYLGFDGFTSTLQDKLFKGYSMEIQTQIFYTTTCSCLLSLCGLVLQGQLLPAIDFMFRHPDCFYDVAILSSVATASQFFISYTIRTFGALTFATVMTTRQLVSILLSCIWFSHPLSSVQWIGAVIVFSALYTKSFWRNKIPHKPILVTHLQGANSATNS